MVKCSAYLCNSITYGNIPDITFHRFPKDQRLCSRWVSNMGLKNWKPTKTCVLCSKHFEKHYIDKSIFRTRLRPGAVPTLFETLPESSEMKKRRGCKGKVTQLANVFPSFIIYKTLNHSCPHCNRNLLAEILSFKIYAN